MNKNIEVLEILNRDSNLSQREISKRAGISVGKVNSILKSLENEGYLEYNQAKNKKYSYIITEKALFLLEQNLKKNDDTRIKILDDTPTEVKQAVILAAGKRKEILNPVGILELEKDISIINRIIDALKNNGINNITVITGYESEKYEHLKETNNVTIINNPKYKWTGTMASLALAEKTIKGDFIVVENDLIFEERALKRLITNPRRDCVVITTESGSNDESFVELRNEFLFKISKDIHALNKIDGEFIGLTKISLDVFRKMLDEYSKNKNPYINYEYTLLDVCRYYDVGYIKINDLIWAEVDNKDHYDKVINYIYPMIKRKELEVKFGYLESLICKLLKVDKSEILNISHLSGVNNNSFKVLLKNDAYSLRIPGEAADRSVNRSVEKYNSKKLYELGISPKDVYFDEKTGIKFSEFIYKAEPINATSAKKEENMKDIAGILKRLHKSNVIFENTFDFQKSVEKYEELIKETSTYIYHQYNEIKKKVFNIYDEIKDDNIKLCPCHNDLIPENIIKSGNGKFYLVDLEYSAMNDYLWDIASLFLECDFSQDDEELFLRIYFKRDIDEKVREKIFKYKILQNFLWSLWGRFKEAENEDLGTFGIDRYNNVKNYIYTRL
ncbi:MAG: winged helix-turn-helix transcriptional regulator [Clostridium sp.]|uniref:winged helix-turn-helix transcriptional regulator n=1 Tax=Clostridium sp. TaxID=1506 RepID=UPI002911A8A0|nr:winged helix-turn-helix transcriptional regulator [Clostridium sp.]